MQEQIKGLSGITKVMVFGIGRNIKFNPLEDLIGIIRVSKNTDVEKILHQKGFENACKCVEL